MRQFSFKHITLWFLLTLMVIIGCQCDNKPTEPKPIVKEYPIYFSNREGNGDRILFKYHPNTQTMDSVFLDEAPSSGVSVSADGKLLYLALRTSVRILDAETFEFIQDLPYDPRNAVVVSTDNKLIAITGDTLRILRTSDYQVIYSDTVYTYNGYFSKDNSTFYCGLFDSTNYGAVYKLELNIPIFSKTIKLFENKFVTFIKPTHNQDKWVLYNDIGSYCAAFEIYDVVLDSIIFTDILCLGGGTTALSPDGKKVYYTAPGSPFQGAESPFIKVFDIETNMIESVIDTTVFYANGIEWALPNDIIVTPDNKYLGVLNDVISSSVFHLIDLQALTVADRRDYGPKGYGFTRMTVQSK